MSGPLSTLLQHVLQGEPELGDEVDAVFRRADQLRRRRTRTLLGAGAVAVAVIATAGYLLTATLLPADVTTTASPAVPQVTRSAVVMPSSLADPVLEIIAPLIDAKQMRIYPRPPERGAGWRQYSVVDHDGKSRGMVEVAVYDSPEQLCFPVLASPDSCARIEWAPGGVAYVRYDDDQDVDWQVHQTIARRTAAARAVAVMATGERGTGSASRGKPALSGAQIEKVATDERIFAAFGADERCDGPSTGACPVFRVPVPIKD